MTTAKQTSRRFLMQVQAESWYRNLSAPQPNARSLLVHLVTGEHVTSVPALWKAGRAYLAECLGWPSDELERCWRELESSGLVEADWEARVIWVRAILGSEMPETPNVVRSWAKAWAGIPACPLKDRARVALAAVLADKGPAFVAAFDEACPGAGSGGVKPGSRAGAAASGSRRKAVAVAEDQARRSVVPTEAGDEQVVPEPSMDSDPSMLGGASAERVYAGVALMEAWWVQVEGAGWLPDAAPSPAAAPAPGLA